MAILAGGKSKRMGRDKALILDSFGHTWLELAVDTARKITDRVILVTGSKIKYSNVNFSIPVEIFADVEPDLGPLGGIITAMNQIKSGYLCCLSCDMPLVRYEDLICMSLPTLEEDAIYVETTYFPMIFHVTSGLLAQLEQFLNGTNTSIGNFLRQIRSKSITIQDQQFLINFNTPLDLSSYEI